MTADYAGDGGWGDDDPTVFVMTVNVALEGEFQVTNGYGPDKAPQVMKVRDMHVIRPGSFTTFFFYQIVGFNCFLHYLKSCHVFEAKCFFIH